MDLAPRPPNRVLALLPLADFELIRSHLRPIALVHQTVLVRIGDPLTHIYFPHSGIISLVIRMAEGETLEAAMVGSDSVFGGSTALDGGIALNEAIVQLPGAASVLDVPQLRKAADQSVTLRTMIIRHEQALYSQTLQSAGCMASHRVEARLSRWLLRARDLSGSDEMMLTQEFLGQMLGVQRSSVSVVANTLQHAGLIRYSRGRIKITDSNGLEDAACECYGIVKMQYEKLRK